MPRQVGEAAPEDYENSLPLAAIRNDFIAKARWDVHAWIGRGQDKTDGYYGAPVFHMSGGPCLKEPVLVKDGLEGTPQKPLSAVTAAYGSLVEAMMSSACQWKGISAARQVVMWRDWFFQSGRGERYRWACPKWKIPFLRVRGYLTGKPEKARRRVLDDCFLVGTLDEIVVWPDAHTGEKVAHLIDWKSTNPRKFIYLDRGELDEGHMRQLATYQATYMTQYAVLTSNGRPGVWHGGEIVPLAQNPRLIYLDRASMRIKQVGVNMEKWWPEARNRWRELRMAWEQYKSHGTLPDPLPLKQDGSVQRKCNYCRYDTVVYKGGEMVCPAQQKAILAARAKGGNGNGGRY